jgi:site-specific DNA-methyltransferase (adenine-specific)
MAETVRGDITRSAGFHGRNPDVLNSIANLSNDEVFTPPGFANRMLDSLEKAWADSNGGENIWANPNLKFLDPFTKSGVFLREIASRLIKGLEAEYPDLQSRVDHILTEQVFGIATTHITSLMARRTLYCSKRADGRHSITKKFKNESGNIWFEPAPHIWGKGKIRRLTMNDAGLEIESYVDGSCLFCGVTRQDFERDEGLELHAYGLIHTEDPKSWVREIFGTEMHFDVIIGNPPYQLEDGGYGTSAAAIYDKFVEQAKALEPRQLVMVIPARWYSGGKGLQQFRARMLADRQIREIVDFPDSTTVFPGVQIKGGVCYFVWKRGDKGPVTVKSNLDPANPSTSERELLEKGSQVFIRYNEALEILRRVIALETRQDSANPELELGSQKFGSLVSSRKPFGFPTFFKGKSQPFNNALLIHQNGGKGYVSRDEVATGKELIDVWKVFIPMAGSGSDSFPHSILGKPFVGAPGEVCSETYNCIGPFKSEEEARNAIQYISTRIFRFLVLLHKPSQHASKSVYTFVPLIDFSKPVSESSLEERWEITSEEKEFINSLIRPMEL